MVEKSFRLESEGILVPLKIVAAISIVAGSWSLIFEIYFFKDFQIDIYFARVLFTVLSFGIFALSFRKLGKTKSTILSHILIMALIASFVISIYKIPSTIFINSQILSLLIFTIAIIFSWEVTQQLIVSIYYNLFFATSIFYGDSSLYHLPNLLPIVLFVGFVSFMSVVTSAIIYKMRDENAKKTDEIKFLFENAPIGICRIDGEGRIITANTYLLDLLGITGDLKNTILFDYINEEHFEKENFQRRILTGIDDSLSIILLNNDERKFLRIFTRMIHGKEYNSTYQCIIKDETKEKLNEIEKNLALEKLFNEAKISERNAHLALDEKNQKIQLLAKINHEVKTPLNSILMFFEMIETNMMNTINDIKDYASSVKISAESLLHTIENFIEFAKIETGKIEAEKEPFNLTELLQETIKLMTPLAEMKNNTIVLSTEDITQNIVYSDGTKYRQVLINLIGNAIKFTHKGTITISAETIILGEHKYSLETTVKDTGSGMPENKMRNIFTPFISLKEEKSGEYGSGLGLAICKEFVKLLGGEISVQSRLGEGTKFEIIIPYEYIIGNRTII
ncbi:MAG: PAS domain-containing sensor histidine kinase [Bacteroidetes bacterium]|nr:PAS domain-containing sensor histidine kinase [Bacteroidota bacterium]